MHSISELKIMKLLLLFFVSNISISLIWATALQYDQKKYLSLNSLSQTHHETDDTNNVDSFELFSIDYLLTKQDPSLTPRDLLTLRHQRGLLRAEALSSSSARVSQRLFYEGGAYLMRVGVGTPPQNVYMFLDTGSDVVWVQCLPCKKCHNPIFDPRESSTFSQIACGDPRCKQLQPYFYDGCHNNTCLYNATYSGGSFSQGAFSTETLKLGEGRKTTNLKNIALGCGHDIEGLLPESAGLIGLGRGDLSFITQTKHQFKSQFSYCLSSNSTSKSSIVFGPSAVPTRKADVYYTPLIYTNTTTMYYYVNLTGISVNGTRVPGIDPSVFDLKPNGFEGGVIFDSGTTYTQLVKPAYVALRKAFRAAMIKKPNKNSTRLGPPMSYLWFDTCYNITREMGQVEVPTVELHFDQGANMTLGPDNTMVEMYDDGTVAIFCFAFISSGKSSNVYVPTVELHFDQGANMTLGVDNTMTLMYVDDTVATFCFAFRSNKWYTTIGNVQQQSIQIVYDLLGSRIGFVPEAC